MKIAGKAGKRVEGRLKSITKVGNNSIQQENDETSGSRKVVPVSTQKESNFTESNADKTVMQKPAGSIHEKIESTLKEFGVKQNGQKLHYVCYMKHSGRTKFSKITC